MSMRRMAGAIAVVSSLVATPAFAVSLGQTDTFADGTLSGWTSGPPSPNGPINVAGGGPAGSGDRYMLLQSTGLGGAGGKLVVFNGAQWSGDFHAAGVAAIGFDVANFGATDVQLRLRFTGPGLEAISHDGIVVPAGSGWTHRVFSLGAAALDGLAGPLNGVSEMRLYHGDSASYPPLDIAARIGIDNIAAVPEASSAWLLALGLAAVAGLRRRH